MGNKVDINKLIKKKFNDKTFDYSDLDKEMDLILEKLDGYWGKVDTAELEEVSQGESVFDHAFGVGGAENPLAKEPGYGGREPSEVIPYKLAETGDGDSGGKTISIAVPDLFSLITNSEMVPGDEDRKMIQSVILNMKDLKTGEGNWIERIKSLQKYMDTVVDQNIVEARDIRRAISNLIFLNLMKKISFFVAQPGKLFEYILAPLIGTDAAVGGKDDKDIIDVTKFSQGKAWAYSIKLFTGKESDYNVKGSRKNLEVAISNFKGKPVTYIIAVANEAKRAIEFAELNVTTDIEYFNKGGWLEYSNMTDGALFLAENKIGLLIHKNKNDMIQGGKKVAQPTTAGISKPKSINITTRKTNFAGIEKTIGQFNQQFKTFKSILDKKNVQELKTELENDRQYGTYATEYTKFLLEQAKKKISKTPEEIKEIDVFINLKTIDFANKLLNDWNDHYNEQYNLVASQQQSQEPVGTQPQQSQEPVGTQPQQSQEPVGTQPQQKEEKPFSIIKPTEYEPPQTPIDGFDFRLKSTWDRLNKISLNLGDPKIYNQYQLNIASNLAEDTEKVLNAYKDLNTNLVKFFATSKEDLGTEPGKQPRAKGQVTQANTETGFGDAVIKNATDIEEGVRGFLEKEGTPSQVKK